MLKIRVSAHSIQELEAAEEVLARAFDVKKMKETVITDGKHFPKAYIFAGLKLRDLPGNPAM